MKSHELFLPPVEGERRNRVTGRFMKGHVPFTKGKKWSDYMSKRKQKRCQKGWKNLDLHRHRPSSAGRPKKSVVALSDDGKFLVFDYVGQAALFCHGCESNVSRCCRQNALHGRNTDHQYKGFRFYYESDDAWLEKVNPFYK